MLTCFNPLLVKVFGFNKWHVDPDSLDPQHSGSLDPDPQTYTYTSFFLFNKMKWILSTGTRDIGYPCICIIPGPRGSPCPVSPGGAGYLASLDTRADAAETQPTSAANREYSHTGRHQNDKTI